MLKSEVGFAVVAAKVSCNGKQALRFVGITDVTIIDAATVASRGIETVLASAEQQIKEIDYALCA